MTGPGFDDIVIRESHPDDDPSRRVWVAVDEYGHGQALAVFVVWLPALDVPHAYDRDTYTVVRARRRGLATSLGEYAVRALAAEPIPITLHFHWKATEAGYGLARKLGIAPDEDRPPYIKEAGVDYNPYSQHRADEGGFQALCEAAARLDLPEPER